MKKAVATLNDEQASALIRSTWGFAQERDRQMLRFLLHTGLKINEFVHLSVGEVFTGKRVKMNLLIPSARGKAPRKVPMDREAREAVATILDYNRSQGYAMNPGDPLLVSRQRNKKDGSYRITARQVQRIVKTLREDAALGFKTTPQTLRHTFARQVLVHGGDLRTLQRLLGHRSIKTTRDLYGVSGAGAV
jgi:integrase/recombinase XerC